MTHIQTFSQQLYDMSKICSINEDTQSKYGYSFIGDSQVTLFSTVYRRPTHYRKFPVELHQVDGVLTITHDEYIDINAINDLILAFKIDKYCPFDQAFSSINLISVKLEIHL